MLLSTMPDHRCFITHGSRLNTSWSFPVPLMEGTLRFMEHKVKNIPLFTLCRNWFHLQIRFSSEVIAIFYYKLLVSRTWCTFNLESMGLFRVEVSVCLYMKKKIRIDRDSNPGPPHQKSERLFILIFYNASLEWVFSQQECRSMGGSPGEEPVTQEKRKKGWRMSCDVGEATEGSENEL